jgi:hypothetical protein
VILKIGDEEAKNSVVATVLFGKAGTLVTLTVRRPRAQPAGQGTKTLTIQRNALGLGLVVDATNTITDLVAGSAVAEHGGFGIGQRVVAVGSQQLPPGTPLAPYIPPGNAAFELTVVEAVAGGVRPRQPAYNIAGGLAGGSSVRSLNAAAADMNPALGRAGTRIGGGFGGATEGGHAPLTGTQLDQLRSAFITLGGGGAAEGRLGPFEVLAFVSHFQPSATVRTTPRCEGGEGAEVEG